MQFKGLDITGYLQKPFDTDRLMAKVEATVRGGLNGRHGTNGG